jgi:DNA-binding transcriptional regulator YiaG
MQALPGEENRSNCKLEGEEKFLSKKTKFKNWRKGSLPNPFCHLVIKAIRWDSPPCNRNPEMLQMTLLKARLQLGLTRDQLTLRLNVSNGTLKNWEHGRTAPLRQFWRAISALTRVRNR